MSHWEAEPAGRVWVRVVAAEDGAALCRAHGASVALHAPWVTPFTDMDGFRTWQGRIAEQQGEALVAIDRRDGGIAGLFALTGVMHGALCSAWLGYHAMAGYAGRGLMTEAMGLVCHHAFRTLGLHRVEANIQPENARSIALVQRAGFQREGYSPRYLRIGGVWRDHERWALLADTEEEPG
jgi:ribosomal-protein-alanine N-acetyltransferase